METGHLTGRSPGVGKAGRARAGTRLAKLEKGGRDERISDTILSK